MNQMQKLGGQLPDRRNLVSVIARRDFLSFGCRFGKATLVAARMRGNECGSLYMSVRHHCWLFRRHPVRRNERNGRDVPRLDDLFRKNAADQPDERVAACTAVIETSAETPQSLAVAYCARGVAYQARDQLDRAMADYNESVRVAPNGPSNVLCRGYGNIAKGAVDEAITNFSEAIAVEPGSAVAFMSRGRAYRMKGDLPHAIADFDVAVQLDPKNPTIFNNRGVAMIYLRNYDRAIKDLTDAIRLNSDYSEAYVNRGLAHAHQREYENAVEDFTEAIRLDPRNAAAYTNRGVAYATQGENARANADFDRAKILSGQ